MHALLPTLPSHARVITAQHIYGLLSYARVKFCQGLVTHPPLLVQL